MSSTNPARSELQEEARSVETSADRLRDLLRQDSSLGPIIASNPSASPALLNELALKHAAEVLANPVIPLRGLEADRPYGEFSLPALVSLCLSCVPEQHADLLLEIRRRLITGLAELGEQKMASLSCVWLHQGTFTLRPIDCDRLISQVLDFKVESRAFVEGSGPITVHDLPEIKTAGSRSITLRRRQLSGFLHSLRFRNFQDFIDDSEITREHNGDVDFKLNAINIPDYLNLDGRELYNGDEFLFEFSYAIHGNDPIFENGYLSVPIGVTDEVELEHEIAMGELIDLAGLELKPDGLTPCDWPTRLAALLIP